VYHYYKHYKWIKQVIFFLIMQAQEGKLVIRNERWNLVFTDFLYEDFQKSSLNTSISLITLNKEVCCSLTDSEKGCSCPVNFEV
jgi:hypothetical protein